MYIVTICRRSRTRICICICVCRPVCHMQASPSNGTTKPTLDCNHWTTKDVSHRLTAFRHFSCWSAIDGSPCPVRVARCQSASKRYIYSRFGMTRVQGSISEPSGNSGDLSCCRCPACSVFCGLCWGVEIWGLDHLPGAVWIEASLHAVVCGKHYRQLQNHWRYNPGFFTGAVTESASSGSRSASWTTRWPSSCEALPGHSEPSMSRFASEG